MGAILFLPQACQRPTAPVTPGPPPSPRPEAAITLIEDYFRSLKNGELLSARRLLAGAAKDSWLKDPRRFPLAWKPASLKGRHGSSTGFQMAVAVPEPTAYFKLALTVNQRHAGQWLEGGPRQEALKETVRRELLQTIQAPDFPKSWRLCTLEVESAWGVTRLKAVDLLDKKVCTILGSRELK